MIAAPIVGVPVGTLPAKVTGYKPIVVAGDEVAPVPTVQLPLARTAKRWLFTLPLSGTKRYPFFTLEGVTPLVKLPDALGKYFTVVPVPPTLTGFNPLIKKFVMTAAIVFFLYIQTDERVYAFPHRNALIEQHNFVSLFLFRDRLRNQNCYRHVHLHTGHTTLSAGFLFTSGCRQMGHSRVA